MKRMTIFVILFVGIQLLLTDCGDASKSTTDDPSTIRTEDAYLQRGKEIAGATFTSLSSALQGTLAEGGITQAISYCNLAAMPLVDSLSMVHQANIRRTSLQVRNPANEPTASEREILQSYHESAEAGDTLRPMVHSLSAKTTAFYAPIKVNTFCLQCHGRVGEELKKEDYDFIKSKYPKDRAVGYQAGDLRGMWSIKFSKEQLSGRSLITTVTVPEFATLMKDEKSVVLDVRTPSETAKGKIEGAREIDVRDTSFLQKINELDKEKTYLVYCRSGKRGARACNLMAEAGFTQLYNLSGGYLAWSAAHEDE